MKRKSETGQAIAAVAIGLVFLIGAVGLAIDMGYMRFEKRRMQSAADSAAIAAASELQYYPSNDPRIGTAARDDSKANGFEDGVNGAVVVPNSPPLDAPFAGRANYVEVKVQQNVPTFFMRIFGVNSSSMSATAVAALGSSRGCVYSLGLVGGLSLGGNLTAPNCGVVDNALLDLGAGCINAASIGVVLNVLGGCATPTPVTGIAPSNDPLAYLAAPAIGACLPNPNVSQPAGVPVVIPAGTYCAGITIRATNAAAVTFQPGLYNVTRFPGLQIQGTGDVTGAGVMFYLSGDAPVLISATGNITFSAPTDALPAAPGVPGGVLFFQDPTNASPAQIVNGTLSLTGSLYFPNTSLTLGGNVPTQYLILVAQSLRFQGAIAIGDPTTGNDYSLLTAGSPIKAASLVQ